MRNFLLRYGLRFYLLALILLWRDGFFDIHRWRMSTLLRNFVSKGNRQLLTIVGKDLCILCSTRDRHIRHAVVEQVFGSQLCIDVN